MAILRSHKTSFQSSISRYYLRFGCFCVCDSTSMTTINNYDVYATPLEGANWWAKTSSVLIHADTDTDWHIRDAPFKTRNVIDEKCEWRIHQRKEIANNNKLLQLKPRRARQHKFISENEHEVLIIKKKNRQFSIKVADFVEFLWTKYEFASVINVFVEIIW